MQDSKDNRVRSKKNQKAKINQFVSILAFFIIVLGCAVVVGWILDIGILKSILPGWVTMKFSTAISFIVSGAILFWINDFLIGNKEIAPVLLPVAVLVIFLLMVPLFISSFFNIYTGIEDLFIKESKMAVRSVAPGRPSIGTMLCFLLVGTAGMLTCFDPKRLPFF